VLVQIHPAVQGVYQIFYASVVVGAFFTFDPMALKTSTVPHMTNICAN